MTRQLTRRIVLQWRRVAIAVLTLLVVAAPAFAHNLSYAALRAKIDADGRFEVQMNFHVAAMLLGAPQGHLPDDLRARWETMSDEELTRLSAEAADYLKGALEVYADGRIVAVDAVTMPKPAQLRADGLVPQEEARPSAPVIASGRLPFGTRSFALAAPPEFPEVLLSLEDASGASVAQVLREGERSHPFLLGGDAAAARSGGVTVTVPAILVTLWQYGSLGFEHIVPKGFDHILFVAALFFLAPVWRTLGWQVTAFTLAHSVTLALAVFGIIRVPAFVVEPLIALSIAAVGVDNLLSDKLRRWRIGAVFAFGLLHGVGFAGVLQATGIPKGEEIAALASFNIGVEAGQVAVLALLFLAVGWFRGKPWFRSWIALPASAAIAGVGVFWTIERVLAYL